MAQGEVRIPNDVVDALKREPLRLAAFCWLERTRDYMDNSSTITERQLAGRFKKSKHWARSTISFWVNQRGTRIQPARDQDSTSAGPPTELITNNNLESVNQRGTRIQPARDQDSTSAGPHYKKQEAMNQESRTTTTYEALFEILLNDGSKHPIAAPDIASYTALYPAVNIEQEIRKMIGWCDASPKQRKTSRGVRKFINGWLARAQDQGPKENQTTGKPAHRYQERGSEKLPYLSPPPKEEDVPF
jgi:hypothetical protein